MARAWPPSRGDSEDAFVAVLEEIGAPVIWLGWSAGGVLGGNLVNERSELFKVLIGIEPANNCLYGPGFIPTSGSVQVPALSIHGINQIGRPSE